MWKKWWFGINLDCIAFNAVCAELLWRKIKCIIFYIIVLSETVHALDIILYERPRLIYVILLITNSCWWPGDSMSQVINRHSVDLSNTE